MMKTILCILVPVVLMAGACAPTVEVTSFGPMPASPKVGELDVYTSHNAVDKPFREIALITVDDEGLDKSESELLSIVISKAREIGADGVIIIGQERQLESGQIFGGVFVGSTRKVVRGSAIVYDRSAMDK